MRWNSVHGKVFVALLLCALFPLTASAEERVSAFVAHIELKQDGSADIQEEIVYDFGDASRRGILREIPLIFPATQKENQRNVEISNVSVTDGKGVLREVNYNTAGNLATLKIGDPDKTVTGPQLYVIRYRVLGAIAPTLLKEKFIWDVTGHEWKVPIDRVRADVVLPAAFSVASLSSTCLAGGKDSGHPCVVSSAHELTADGLVHSLRFEENGLVRNEGLTLEIELPKGSILYSQSEHDTSAKTYTVGVVKWWRLPFVDISLALPFFVFAGLYSVWFSQHAQTRPRKSKKKRGSPTEGREFPRGLSDREAYLLASIVVGGMSFFVTAWNFGILLSGVVIFCFAWVYPIRK